MALTPPPVVPIPSAAPSSPAYLSPAMKKLWRRILADFEIAPYEIPMLAQALSLLDLAENARRTVAIEGPTIPGLHSPRVHPCCSIQRSSVLSACRILRQLGLQDIEAEALGRPKVASSYA